VFASSSSALVGITSWVSWMALCENWLLSNSKSSSGYLLDKQICFLPWWIWYLSSPLLHQRELHHWLRCWRYEAAASWRSMHCLSLF
jgi:hypothetical protein